MIQNKKDQPYKSQLKGVSAFFGDTSTINTISKTVPIESIYLPIHQPRRYFDPEKLDQLAISIKHHGVLEPLIVRPLSDGKLELVAGERRLKASLIAGLTEIPVTVKDLSDEEAIHVAIIENLQREDLNPVELTEGILQIVALRLNITLEAATSVLYRMQNEVKGKVTQNVLGNSEGITIQAIFDSLGLMSWESFTSSHLPLLNLPQEVLNILRSGQIEYTKAKAIARVKDEAQRQKLLSLAIAEDLSLSQIKEQIAIFNAATANPEAETPSLKKRFDITYQQVKKSKIWDNPKKKRQMEKLLTQLQALIQGEEA